MQKYAARFLNYLPSIFPTCTCSPIVLERRDWAAERTLRLSIIQQRPLVTAPATTSKTNDKPSVDNKAAEVKSVPADSTQPATSQTATANGNSSTAGKENKE